MAAGRAMVHIDATPGIWRLGYEGTRAKDSGPSAPPRCLERRRVLERAIAENAAPVAEGPEEDRLTSMSAGATRGGGIK